MGAALFGTYAAVLGRLREAAGRGADAYTLCLELLATLRSSGTPLLLSNPLVSSAGSSDGYSAMYHAWSTGSPILLARADPKARDIFGIVRPMGVPVATDDSGFLVDSTERVEAWAMVAAVPDPNTARFNDWAAALDTRAGVLPACTAPLSCLYNELTLGTMGDFLGDFRLRVEALRRGLVPAPPPKTAAHANKPGRPSKKRELSATDAAHPDHPDNAKYWRRALVLQRVVQSDSSGLGQAALRGVLPDSVLGPAMPVTEPAVQVVPVQVPAPGVTLRRDQGFDAAAAAAAVDALM